VLIAIVSDGIDEAPLPIGALMSTLPPRTLTPFTSRQVTVLPASARGSPQA
jgi:hypothetical protein